MGTAFLEAKPWPSVFTELNLLPGLFGNVCDWIQTVKIARGYYIYMGN